MVIEDDTGPRLGAGDGNKAPVSVGWACGCSCLTLGDNELAGCCCTSCDAGDEDTAARPRGSRADHRIRTGETAPRGDVSPVGHGGVTPGESNRVEAGPDQAARELERCVTKLGFKGVMVSGYTEVESPDNLVYLDDWRMTPLWEATVVRSRMATPRRFTNCRWELKSVDALTPQLSDIGGPDENPA
jgi:hypothetical protein